MEDDFSNLEEVCRKCVRIEVMKNLLLNFLQQNKDISWNLSHHDFCLIKNGIDKFFRIYDLNNFLYENNYDNLIFKDINDDN